MRWAFRRQLIYAFVIILALGLVLLGLWFAFFYHSATCFDGIQNQDEIGIDCGGSCTHLCAPPQVNALWARAVLAGPGVYHAVALVKNPLTDAGVTSLPYTFSLYDSSNVLVAERSGTMYLGPGEVAPLFEGDIVTGNRVPAYTKVAFDKFGTALWQKMSPEGAPPISVTSQSAPGDVASSLRLSAHITNTTALLIPKATVTALLYDADGNIVNASQTVVSDFAARGEKDVTFTWQEPFSSSITRIDIIPRVH